MRQVYSKSAQSMLDTIDGIKTEIINYYTQIYNNAPLQDRESIYIQMHEELDKYNKIKADIILGSTPKLLFDTINPEDLELLEKLQEWRSDNEEKTGSQQTYIN